MVRPRERTFRSRIGRWASVSASSFAAIFSGGTRRYTTGSYAAPSQNVAVDRFDRPRQKADGWRSFSVDKCFMYAEYYLSVYWFRSTSAPTLKHSAAWSSAKDS